MSKSSLPGPVQRSAGTRSRRKNFCVQLNAQPQKELLRSTGVWGILLRLAGFCCGSFDLAKTGARRQRQLAVSSAGRASLSLLQQVSSGKVDSQANCLLKLWYQQALLAASLESIWHSFLSIDLSCLLRNRLTWIKQTKVFFKESFQLFNNSLFLLISWTPAAKT